MDSEKYIIEQLLDDDNYQYEIMSEKKKNSRERNLIYIDEDQ